LSVFAENIYLTTGKEHDEREKAHDETPLLDNQSAYLMWTGGSGGNGRVSGTRTAKNTAVANTAN